MNRFRFPALLYLAVLVSVSCTTSKTGEGDNQTAEKNNPRPNIILIMADDMGYSDIGCYGSEINTPNLDRLAREGVRFTSFYNASVCCPTRASLMTGLYQHQAGVGLMDSDMGYESYQGRIKHSVATVAEVLSRAGYETVMSGKWHLGTREGDNPWERGFDNFYGIPKGGGVYFWPTILDRPVVEYDHASGKGPVVTQPDPATFYSTDAFTDYAVSQISEKKDSRNPFFMYVAYIAPHFPQQAREEDIQKYLTRYDKGWEVLRKERYARQVKMGIIDEQHPLSPQTGLDWDSLSAERKKEFSRQMAVYAAQVDVLDQNVGKILTALEQHQLDDNTIVFFLSDNGGQKNAPEGFEKHPGTVFGSKESYGGYGRNWANLSNTPFRQFKHDQTNGGNSTPFIVRWPSALEGNKISRQVGHIIDIFPTCVAAAGIDSVDLFPPGRTQTPEGINLLPYFKDTAQKRDRQLFWEHRGNQAVRDGDWKLVASFGGKWELYNLAEDATELNDLSEEFPDRVKKLKADYQHWAERAGVLPWPVVRR